MAHQKNVFLLGILLIVVLTLVPAAAQKESSSPLLDMLALVPVGAVENGDVPLWSYIDYRALEEARGITSPANREAFAADETNARFWINAFLRVQSGPAFQFLQQHIEEMPEAVGFDFFAIDRGLSFGTPPRTGMILNGRFAAEPISTVLLARDFEEIDRAGITIWRRYEDATVNIEARNMADPFGGHIGQAARIAHIPGPGDQSYLANSAVDNLTFAIVDAAVGERPSLAGRAGFRLLAEAVTDPTRYNTPLIQASVYSVLDVGLIPDDPLTAILGGTDDSANPVAGYGELPLYSLAMLADRQEGDEEIHLIALAYEDGPLAEIAAKELASRLRLLTLPGVEGGPLVEQYGSTVTPYVYQPADGGPAIALAEVRQTGPALGEEMNGMLVAPGRMFRLWNQMLTRREFYPLRILAEE